MSTRRRVNIIAEWFGRWKLRPLKQIMTEVLVEKVESNYTSNFWQGPCPNWLHLSWPPVWPTPHQTSKCMMVYHVLHVLLNLLFSTGKPRNVFLSVLRQETGFSRKDNSLTQTWVNPCWHCSWVCFDSKLDAAVHPTMNKDLEGNEQTLDSWLFVLFKCATHPECWWKFNETWRRSYLSSTRQGSYCVLSELDKSAV